MTALLILAILLVSFGLSWINGRLGFVLWIGVTVCTLVGAIGLVRHGAQSLDDFMVVANVIYVWFALLASFVWLTGMTAARVLRTPQDQEVD